MSLRSLTAAAVVVVGSVIVFAGLEAAMRFLAPPEAQDPRLGLVAFWVWVGCLAVTTYFAVPFFAAAEGPLDALARALGIIGWLAWKLGFNDGWEDSPREREQLWATAVAMAIGLAGREFIR